MKLHDTALERRLKRAARKEMARRKLKPHKGRSQSGTLATLMVMAFLSIPLVGGSLAFAANQPERRIAVMGFWALGFALFQSMKVENSLWKNPSLGLLYYYPVRMARAFSWAWWRSHSFLVPYFILFYLLLIIFGNALQHEIVWLKAAGAAAAFIGVVYVSSLVLLYHIPGIIKLGLWILFLTLLVGGFMALKLDSANQQLVQQVSQWMSYVLPGSWMARLLFTPWTPLHLGWLIALLLLAWIAYREYLELKQTFGRDSEWSFEPALLPESADEEDFETFQPTTSHPPASVTKENLPVGPTAIRDQILGGKDLRPFDLLWTTTWSMKLFSPEEKHLVYCLRVNPTLGPQQKTILVLLFLGLLVATFLRYTEYGAEISLVAAILLATVKIIYSCVPPLCFAYVYQAGAAIPFHAFYPISLRTIFGISWKLSTVRALESLPHMVIFALIGCWVADQPWWLGLLWVMKLVVLIIGSMPAFVAIQFSSGTNDSSIRGVKKLFLVFHLIFFGIWLVSFLIAALVVQTWALSLLLGGLYSVGSLFFYLGYRRFYHGAAVDLVRDMPQSDF